MEMIDREKILRAWERCKVCNMGLLSADPNGEKAYLECEYTTGVYCRQDKLRNDTIALLKEQVKPIVDDDEYRCGECGHRVTEQKMYGDNVLFEERYSFCPACGKAVMWE